MRPEYIITCIFTILKNLIVLFLNSHAADVFKPEDLFCTNIHMNFQDNALYFPEASVCVFNVKNTCGASH